MAQSDLNNKVLLPYAVKLSNHNGAPDGLTECNVSNVVDGDTIDVAGCLDAGRIRLILIDTPEVFGGAECYGAEASNYTKAHLSIGEIISLERDTSNTDRFGRLLRYVWADGELFNWRMVFDGYAALAVYPPDTKYQSIIAGAQAAAQSSSRGLWPVCGGVDTPIGAATPTPTATPTATATPVQNATATPTATSTPVSAQFQLPACYAPGVNACNCSDFTSRGHAQWFHDNYDPTDINGLDSDEDGIACESLPASW